VCSLSVDAVYGADLGPNRNKRHFLSVEQFH
jgi:hypothetical protein